MNNKIKNFQGRLNKLIKNYPSVPVEQYIIKGNREVSEKFDPDSSPVAWKYFLSIYKELFFENYSFGNSFIEKDDKKTETFWIEDCRPEYKRICGTFEYKILNNKFQLKLTKSPLDVGKNIGMAGDCCFNFNEKKVGLFAALLCNETNTKLRNDVMDLVFSFHKMHYSPLNFALMPTNGGLNIFKGYDSFDRLSSLLYWINEFYKNNSIQVFSAGKGRPMDALNDFLSKLKDNKKIKYHNVFYPEIDENLYNCLLINGEKKTLENTNDIIEYLELAIRFWEAKADYCDKQIGNSLSNII